MDPSPGDGAVFEESVANPTLDAVLLSAVLRSNDINKAAGDNGARPLRDDASFSLGHRADDADDRILRINIKDPGREGTQEVEIGHYDPARGIYVVYPELVHSDEAAVVLAEALRVRDIQLRSPSRTLDYDAKIIRDLRKKQREVLSRDGLIGRITDRFNKIRAGEPHYRELGIDDATSYYVGLYFTADPGISSSASIKIDGAFNMTNGVKVRRDEHIGLAQMDPSVGVFVPDSDLVTQEEFGSLSPLITDLIEAKVTHPALDTEAVGMGIK